VNAQRDKFREMLLSTVRIEKFSAVMRKMIAGWFPTGCAGLSNRNAQHRLPFDMGRAAFLFS